MLLLVCDHEDLRSNLTAHLRSMGEEPRACTTEDFSPAGASIVVFVTDEPEDDYPVFDTCRGLPVLCLTRKTFSGSYEGVNMIPLDHIIAGYIMEYVKKQREHETSDRLLSAISEGGSGLSIFVHDNPDPDALASAMALECICEHAGVTSIIYYSGDIGHPENEILMGYTNLHLERIGEMRNWPKHHEPVAFVDFARPGENNALPEHMKAKIIIDHHYTNLGMDEAHYTEIVSVGATSTLMTRHLRNLGIEIPSVLATALLYGIKVDTMDFTRNLTHEDFHAIMYLYDLADQEILDVLGTIPMDPHTVDALGRAIASREVKEGVMTAFAGEVVRRDDIPQVADLLEGERDISTVLVSGISGGNVHMSARSKSPDINLGVIMKKAFSHMGTAGGHTHSAGGCIPVPATGDISELLLEISDRFRKAVKGE